MAGEDAPMRRSGLELDLATHMRRGQDIAPCVILFPIILYSIALLSVRCMFPLFYASLSFMVFYCLVHVVAISTLVLTVPL